MDAFAAAVHKVATENTEWHEWLAANGMTNDYGVGPGVDGHVDVAGDDRDGVLTGFGGDPLELDAGGLLSHNSTNDGYAYQFTAPSAIIAAAQGNFDFDLMSELIPVSGLVMAEGMLFAPWPGKGSSELVSFGIPHSLYFDLALPEKGSCQLSPKQVVPVTVPAGSGGGAAGRRTGRCPGSPRDHIIDVQDPLETCRIRYYDL